MASRGMTATRSAQGPKHTAAVYCQKIDAGSNQVFTCMTSICLTMILINLDFGRVVCIFFKRNRFIEL